MFISFIEIDPAEFLEHFIDAAERGDTRVVVEMLDAGMPVDSRGVYGYTAVECAALNNHADVVQLLLKKGADVNKRDGIVGWTPLHVAAWQNSTGVIKVLQQQGALINRKDNFGRLPLDIAREYNNEESAHLLEQH